MAKLNINIAVVYRWIIGRTALIDLIKGVSWTKKKDRENMRKRLTDYYDLEIKVYKIYKQVLADLTITSMLLKATQRFGRLKKV